MAKQIYKWWNTFTSPETNLQSNTSATKGMSQLWVGDHGDRQRLRNLFTLLLNSIYNTPYHEIFKMACHKNRFCFFVWWESGMFNRSLEQIRCCSSAVRETHTLSLWTRCHVYMVLTSLEGSSCFFFCVCVENNNAKFQTSASFTSVA